MTWLKKLLGKAIVALLDHPEVIAALLNAIGKRIAEAQTTEEPRGPQA